MKYLLKGVLIGILILSAFWYGIYFGATSVEAKEQIPTQDTCKMEIWEDTGEVIIHTHMDYISSDIEGNIVIKND